MIDDRVIQYAAANLYANRCMLIFLCTCQKRFNVTPENGKNFRLIGVLQSLFNMQISWMNSDLAWVEEIYPL